VSHTEKQNDDFLRLEESHSVIWDSRFGVALLTLCILGLDLFLMMTLQINNRFYSNFCYVYYSSWCWYSWTSFDWQLQEKKRQQEYFLSRIQWQCRWGWQMNFFTSHLHTSTPTSSNIYRFDLNPFVKGVFPLVAAIISCFASLI